MVKNDIIAINLVKYTFKLFFIIITMVFLKNLFKKLIRKELVAVIRYCLSDFIIIYFIYFIFLIIKLNIQSEKIFLIF